MFILKIKIGDSLEARQLIYSMFNASTIREEQEEKDKKNKSKKLYTDSMNTVALASATDSRTKLAKLIMLTNNESNPSEIKDLLINIISDALSHLKQQATNSKFIKATIGMFTSLPDNIKNALSFAFADTKKILKNTEAEFDDNATEGDYSKGVHSSHLSWHNPLNKRLLTKA